MRCEGFEFPFGDKYNNSCLILSPSLILLYCPASKVHLMFSSVNMMLLRQRYICTFLFCQDYLELLFNSTRASGRDFSFYFFHFNKSVWHLFELYFIFPSDEVGSCSVICESESLYVFWGSWNKSPTQGQFRPFSPISWQGGAYPSTSGDLEPHPLLQTFLQLFGQVLSIKTLCLEENAVVFVFRHILKKLLCDICCGRLVTDALTATFDQSSHLLKLKNRGGLMIPSEVTARVVR